MHIVFVEHGNSKEFCFRVPDDLAPYIKKNMTVLVKTMYGLAVGKTTTGVISGKGARDIAIKHGAYLPLKPVVSFLDDKLKYRVRQELAKELWKS